MKLAKVSMLACFVVGAGLIARTRAGAQNSEWRSDYAAALQEARDTGKPLFAIIR